MDEHLDTSWCPVCDKMIMPKRYVVPIGPLQAATPQSSTNANSEESQTRTRGKNATSKARGGGLLQGTGRLRPGGGLRRESSRDSTTSVTAMVKASRAQSESISSPQTRTVIEQAQTPLYCSEECRMADAETAWESVSPSSSAPPSLSKPPLRVGTQPSLLRPSQSSTSFSQPPSPLSRAPAAPLQRPMPRTAANVNGLRLTLPKHPEPSDAAASGSGSSSSATGTGTSFTATTMGSDASQTTPEAEDERAEYPVGGNAPQTKSALRKILSDLHASELPVSPRAASSSSFQAGVSMAAKRLSGFFAGQASGSGVKDQRGKERDAKKAEEVRLRDKMEASKQNIEPNTTRNRLRASSAQFYPSRDVLSPPASPISPCIASRTQSALDLYAKYSFFSRSQTEKRQPKRSSMTAMPTVCTSLQAAYAVPSSLPASASHTRSVDNSTTPTRSPSQSKSQQSPLRGLDNDELRARKRFNSSSSRSVLPKGAEGRLLVPDVLLLPKPSAFQPSTSLPSSTMFSPSGLSRMGTRVQSMQSLNLRRHDSEASVPKRNVGDVLGRVTEEGGVWHLQDKSADSSEKSRSVSGSRSRSQERTGNRKERSGKKGRNNAGLSLPERGRLNMEARNWNYENIDGPAYDAMPPVPIMQQRFEEVFIPDPPPPGSHQPPRPSTAVQDTEQAQGRPYIAIAGTHARDVELARRAVREVGRRRGSHAGRNGWWIEHEWEVLAIPERKRLFLFGNGRAGERDGEVQA